MAAADNPLLAEVPEFQAVFDLRPAFFRRAGMLEETAPAAVLIREILVEGPAGMRVDLMIDGQPTLMGSPPGLFTWRLSKLVIGEGALLGVAFCFRRWRPWQRGRVTLWGRQLGDPRAER